MGYSSWLACVAAGRVVAADKLAPRLVIANNNWQQIKHGLIMQAATAIGLRASWLSSERMANNKPPRPQIVPIKATTVIKGLEGASPLAMIS